MNSSIFATENLSSNKGAGADATMETSQTETGETKTDTDATNAADVTESSQITINDLSDVFTSKEELLKFKENINKIANNIDVETGEIKTNNTLDNALENIDDASVDVLKSFARNVVSIFKDFVNAFLDVGSASWRLVPNDLFLDLVIQLTGFLLIIFSVFFTLRFLLRKILKHHFARYKEYKSNKLLWLKWLTFLLLPLFTIYFIYFVYEVSDINVSVKYIIEAVFKSIILTLGFLTFLQFCFSPRYSIFRLIKLNKENSKAAIATFIKIGTYFFPFILLSNIAIVPSAIDRSVLYVLLLILGTVSLFALWKFSNNLLEILENSLGYEEELEKYTGNNLAFIIHNNGKLLLLLFHIPFVMLWISNIPNNSYKLVYAMLIFSVIVFGLLASSTIAQKVHRAIENSAAFDKRYIMKRVSPSTATIISWFVRILFLLAIVFFTLMALQVNYTTFIESDKFLNATYKLLITLLIFITLVSLEKLICNAMDYNILKLEAANDNYTVQRRKTVFPIIKNIIMGLAFIIALMIVLAVFSVNLMPLIAGAGFVGIAVGFGAQKFIADFISGISNLIEDTMKVGDIITVLDIMGTVEQINIRSVRIRDNEGTLHIIPFGGIEDVSNHTKDFAYALMVFNVSYDTDINKAVSAINSVAEEMKLDEEVKYKIEDDIEVLGVDMLSSSSIDIKIRVKTKPGEQWFVKRYLNKAVKLKFDEEGIEIPYPHQTIIYKEA